MARAIFSDQEDWKSQLPAQYAQPKEEETDISCEYVKKFHVSQQMVGFAKESLDEESDESKEIPTWRSESEGSPTTQYGQQLTSHQKEQLQQPLNKYDDIFKDTPGHTNLAEHRIPTGDAQPARQPPYQIPHVYCETVKQKLDEMLEAGLISKLRSEWSSPIVLVKKKDDTIRLCIDYRRLNSCSQTDTYPMPRSICLLISKALCQESKLKHSQK